MNSLAIILLAQASPPGASSASSMLIPMLCMVVIFYFLLIRPQQKKQKELTNLISSLKTGDKVVTTGGIHGIVANVKEGTTLSLKIAENTRIEVDKVAIAMVDRGTPATPAKA